MLDVIGFGENSVDYIYEVPSLPGALSAKLPILSRTVRPGGQVATTMAACAMLGLRAGYIGAFGSDAGGDMAKSALSRRQVDLRHAFTRNAVNRYAVILVAPNGERAVLWERDPRLSTGPSDVKKEWLLGVRALHVDAVDEHASIALARLGREAGLLVTCDIDTVTPRTADLLAAVTVPILAEHVPSELTGESSLDKALRVLRKRHACTVVVTLGARGAIMLEGDELCQAPAFPVQAVDTTSAGDVFRAGFIYGMLHNIRGVELLRIANAAAAVSCTRPGAIDSVPSLDDVRGVLTRENTKTT